jgi:hypothetical protein
MPPMKKRRKQTQWLTVGDILRRAMRNRGLSPAPGSSVQLTKAWQAAVGPQIAAQTAPLKCQGETLFVKVSSPLWMHHLHYLKADILQRFRDHWPETPPRSLFFTVGHFPEKTGSPEPISPDAPLSDRDQEMVRQCLGTLRDEELKYVLERVMRRELLRRRQIQRQGPKKWPGAPPRSNTPHT